MNKWFSSEELTEMLRIANRASKEVAEIINCEFMHKDNDFKSAAFVKAVQMMLACSICASIVEMLHRHLEREDVFDKVSAAFDVVEPMIGKMVDEFIHVVGIHLVRDADELIPTEYRDV